MTATVVVSLHDVAPASIAPSRRWLEMVERHGMVASLLVIPGPWRGHSLADAPECVRWLHEAVGRGHEVVLHGWEHRAVSAPSGALLRSARAAVRARGCAEFATLDAERARHRVELGLGVLARHGFRPEGFVPPGWLALRSTDRVLADLDFTYTTTQWEVRVLSSEHTIRIPSTSQRPASLFTGTAASANLAVTRRFADRGRSMRIALHPDDLLDHRLEAATDRMLSMLGEAGHHSVTYRTLVSSSPAEAVHA
jgi:uncharacterized protein